jgi:hypothetical protein
VTDYQIWPATSGPGAATVDASGVSLATEFYVTDPGLYAKALRFWRADTTILGPITGRLYQVTDAATGSAVAGTDVTFTLSGTGWQTAAFTAPVALAPGQRYRAVVNFPINYSATPNYWSTGGGAADIVTGPLTAPSAPHATGGDQGSYVVGGSLGYPVNSFNSTAYWVDVEVTDSAGQTVTLGLAQEIDTARAVAGGKTRQLGQATEDNTATPLAGRKTLGLGQPAELDTATSVTAAKRRTLGQPQETDTAYPLTGGTPTTPAGWPDIETVMCDLLADLGNTGDRTPADLQDHLIYIRIRRTGGTDDGITDRPRVDVEVFGPARNDVDAPGVHLAGAWPAAEQVRQRLTPRGPIIVQSGGRTVVIDKATQLTGPVEKAWPDPNIRMFAATYLFALRRPWP